jgi:hypothetical protein
MITNPPRWQAAQDRRGEHLLLRQSIFVGAEAPRRELVAAYGRARAA